MILDSLSVLNLYHCNQNQHNKVWGTCMHGNNWWAFWGGINKSWSFKHHGVDSASIVLDLSDLASSKVRKGYHQISLAQMDELDATWRDRFNERFTYFVLLHTPT